MKEKGKFIVFEGLDGSGHTTQAEMAVSFIINGLGRQAVYTKEPTDDFGKQIREILRNDNKNKFTPLEKQQLFIADRIIHIRKEIIPQLEDGVNVICDRYIFSTLAYGWADGAEERTLFELNSSFLKPDATIFLDVSASICMERIKKRGEKKEHFEKLKMLEKVRSGYRRHLDSYPPLSPNMHSVIGATYPKKVFEGVKSIIDRTIDKD